MRRTLHRSYSEFLVISIILSIISSDIFTMYLVSCACIEPRVGNWCTLEGEQHAVWITLFKTGRFL